MSLSVGINFEWALFCATLCSYKSESYLNNNIIKYADRKSLLDLSYKISDNIKKAIPLNKELHTFFSLVKKHQNFTLEICMSDKIKEILSLFSIKNSIDFNHFMLFEIFKNKSDLTNHFDALSKQFGTFIAIHGSGMNRFYNILQNGLNLPQFNDKPGIFGTGIYLTNKLDVALHFAPSHVFNCGLFENHSIKATVVCEVIKHPTSVIRKEHQKSDGFSFNGNIPPEYFLVKDECMIRVTHVLICSSNPISNIKPVIFSESRKPLEQNSTLKIVFQTFRSHWLLFTLFIYILILVIISLRTGKSVIFSNWDTSDLLDADKN